MGKNRNRFKKREKEPMRVYAFLEEPIRDDLPDQNEFRNWKSFSFYFVESKMSSRRNCTTILTASRESKTN